MKVIFIFIAQILLTVSSQDDGTEILSVSVDGLLMANAKITASATCGVETPEEYCKLVDEISNQPQINRESHVQCAICDDRNETKRHPIEYAKSDDDNLWWQSPSMAQGLKYQNINVTIDLNQVYQIVYIILKMGDSPRPGNWIFERSLDGKIYLPWIFFAENPYSCYNLFQRYYPDIKLTADPRPEFLDDDEIFCTTYYSEPKSLISGEIIISLINGRKSVMNEEYTILKSIPQTLINFLSARYIRFRFLKHLTLAADLMTQKGSWEKPIYNRYFYSLRNIEIGGKCICNNHADRCDKVVDNGLTVARCNCKHNTCGSNCEVCCPLFNQKPWKPVVPCEECNCNRKSDKCVYNQTVATLQLSVNKMGRVEGGGVCLNCRENTEGVNCEKCKKGFYRPWNVLATQQSPCRPCSCYGIGTIGNCVSNGEEVENQKPGDCICKKGYTGEKCDACSLGYERYSNGECSPCPCSIDGSVISSLYRCKPPCNCKVNVDPSSDCKACKSGFFNLDPQHPEGCEACYCFGITNQCSSLSARNMQIQDLTNWTISTINGEKTTKSKSSSTGNLISEDKEIDKIFDNPTVYYWLAPKTFLGNWLTSYGSILRYVVKIELVSKIKGSLIDSSDVIIKCGNLRLFHSISGEERRLQRGIFIYLKHSNWKLGQSDPQKESTKDEFISCLVNVDALMIKAKYYSNQKSIELLNVTLSRGDTSYAMNQMLHIEKCFCPLGYSGLSCESCEKGYRRVNNVFYKGVCEPCKCNNHSEICDSYTGECTNCLYNTTGPQCDECQAGFYGDPKLKEKNSCKRCLCPLIDYQMTEKCSTYSSTNYICHECVNHTTGARCDKCIDGYFGNPMMKIPCQKCNCNNNQDSCSHLTGECKCSYNTMGAACQYCRHGFFGNAVTETCKKCDCNSIGSVNETCHMESGQCPCKMNFVNRNCDSCSPGFYLQNDKCIPCHCSTEGRIISENFCNSSTGECYCREGVNGNRCDRCLPEFYGYPNCKKCLCTSHALSLECNEVDGMCKCGSNVVGRTCDKCINEYYWANQTDCAACNCGKGAIHRKCDIQTGQCPCANSVDMRDCSKCKIGYYNLSSNGCQKCPNCINGKVCDNDGICVCPPNTFGNLCEKCKDDSWGYNQSYGCQKCNCFVNGALSDSCNQLSGRCQCRHEYEGSRCDRCREGYYGFPNCRSCDCFANGTLSDRIMKCDSLSGQCQCKQNVMGNKCQSCKNGYFPSGGTYDGGCFSCFCIGVTEQCKPLLNHRIIENESYEYYIYNGNKFHGTGNTYSVIKLNPNSRKKFDWPLSMFRPVYVDVLSFYNSPDMSLFYGSVILKAKIECSDGKCGRDNTSQTEVILESYNGLFELRYLVNNNFSSGQDIIIEINERSKFGKWIISKYKNDSLNKLIYLDDRNVINIDLTRDIFMMALLNVTSFKLKLYSDKINPSFVKLFLAAYNVIQTTENVGKPIVALEKCKCSPVSTGNHCQNPKEGYYKQIWRIPDVNIKLEFRTGNRIRVNLKKCDCNGHSNICDVNTGRCFNCSHNTFGDKCQYCSDGFYGQATNYGVCQSCPCPTEQYNFAQKCTKISSNYFECQCQSGYMGSKCEICKIGYYGDPKRNIPCKSCDCNSEGSLSDGCDRNGVCQCEPGITGDKCDQCAPNFVVENRKCRDCYSDCTKELMVRVDKINQTIGNLQKRKQLSGFKVKVKDIDSRIKNFSTLFLYFNKYISAKDDLQTLSIKMEKIKKIDKNNSQVADTMKKRYIQIQKQLQSIFKDINDTIKSEKKQGSTGEISEESQKILDQIKDLVMKMPNSIEAQYLKEKMVKYINWSTKIMSDIKDGMQSNDLKNLMTLEKKLNLANKINEGNKQFLDSLEKRFQSQLLSDILTNLEISKIEKDVEKFQNNKTRLTKGISELNENVKKNLNNLEACLKRFNELNKLKETRRNDTTKEKEYIIPDSMQKEVETILDQNSVIVGNLTKDFQARDARFARSAYNSIVDCILAVDKIVNKTQENLVNKQFPLNIQRLNKGLNDTRIKWNHFSIQKENKSFLYENLSKQYEVLKENHSQLKQNNMLLRANISDKIISIDPLKSQANLTQFRINFIQQNLIISINKSLMNFQLPEMKSKINFDDLKMNITYSSSQYNEMKQDSQLINETISKLRENIKSLRERLRKTKIMTDLIHGAAARSAEPIRSDLSCVRHYVTYHIPKSNAFSIEFYIKPVLHPQKSLVLFGYDDSDSPPHTFAFVVDENNQHQFLYEYNSQIESVEYTKTLNINNYFGVSVKWTLRRWEMVMNEISNNSVPENPISKKHVEIHENIRIGPKTNVFIGGFPSSELTQKLKLDGKLITHLKDNYATNYYKGCVFGVRLMNSEFGLQDIEAVESECFKSVTSARLLQEDFNCKVNIENIKKFKASLQRKKRDVDSDYGIQFFGNGFAMINTSKVRGNCKTQLNTILTISTTLMPLMKMSTFQMVAVFVNHAKDIGFILGLQNEQYHLGYWTKESEEKLRPIPGMLKNFEWNIFSGSIDLVNSNFFGIKEICDSNSLFYLGNIPKYEEKLLERLKRLGYQEFGFVGRMKLKAKKENEFQVLATRFINIIFLPSERIYENKFYSLYISSIVKESIDITPNFDSGILQSGFAFTVDFMGRPVKGTLTLLTIESNDGKIKLEVTPDLVFSLYVNENKLENSIPKSNKDDLDWGDHYIVVYLNVHLIISVSMSIDKGTIKSDQWSTVFGLIKSVTLGSSSNTAHSYYIYNLFLGPKQMDFNNLNSVPDGVLLKWKPTLLQPEDSSSSSINFTNPMSRVSSKHDQIPSNAAALSYSNSQAFYYSSNMLFPSQRNKVTKHKFYWSKVKDYPKDPVWFSGMSKSFSRLINSNINQYFKSAGNEFSLLLRSASLRPEMLFSLNFGTNKILDILIIDGRLVVYESLKKFVAEFPLLIIDEEWHNVKIIINDKLKERSVRIIQDNHIFDFLSGPYTYASLLWIDVGGTLNLNSNILYKGKNYNLNHLTGCVDGFTINNKSVSLINEYSGNLGKTCPKFQLVKSGGEILQSYADVISPFDIIKFKKGVTQINSDNKFVTNLRFRYSSSSHGTILIIGDGNLFCFISIKNNSRIYLHNYNAESGSSDSTYLELFKGKWNSVKFVVYNDDQVMSLCSMNVNGAHKSLTFNGFFKDGFYPTIYFGTHPDLSDSKKFEIAHTRNFVGCISELEYLVNDNIVSKSLETSDYITSDRCSVDNN